MNESISVASAALALKQADDILIITHKNPDGDTLGCGFAMWAALTSLGKRARVANDGIIPARYTFMTDEYEKRAVADFEPRFILCVDTAALKLAGETMYEYAQRADLCIDHHGTNEFYAKQTLVDAESASACEIVGLVIDELGAQYTPYIASCLYAGVSTDTGCFRYSNTTASSHRFAARLFDSGIDFSTLNRLLFETKSRARAMLEQMAVASMEFALDGKLAFITVTREMMSRAGCDPSDIEGITPIPRMIEGVDAGVTLRELQNGNWKVSVRTVSLDAAKICSGFGGGGHVRAAGFECSGSAYDVKCAVTETVKQELGD